MTAFFHVSPSYNVLGDLIPHDQGGYEGWLALRRVYPDHHVWLVAEGGQSNHNGGLIIFSEDYEAVVDLTVYGIVFDHKSEWNPNRYYFHVPKHIYIPDIISIISEDLRVAEVCADLTLYIERC